MLQRRPAVRCQASATGTAAAPHAVTSVPRPQNALLVNLVEALFQFPPFFSMAAKNVRGMGRPGSPRHSSWPVQ